MIGNNNHNLLYSSNDSKLRVMHKNPIPGDDSNQSWRLDTVLNLDYTTVPETSCFLGLLFFFVDFGVLGYVCLMMATLQKSHKAPIIHC